MLHRSPGDNERKLNMNLVATGEFTESEKLAPLLAEEVKKVHELHGSLGQRLKMGYGKDYCWNSHLEP